MSCGIVIHMGWCKVNKTVHFLMGTVLREDVIRKYQQQRMH